jgi:hypothetical protein
VIEKCLWRDPAFELRPSSQECKLVLEPCNTHNAFSSLSCFKSLGMVRDLEVAFLLHVDITATNNASQDNWTSSLMKSPLKACSSNMCQRNAGKFLFIVPSNFSALGVLGIMMYMIWAMSAWCTLVINGCPSCIYKEFRST